MWVTNYQKKGVKMQQKWNVGVDNVISHKREVILQQRLTMRAILKFTLELMPTFVVGIGRNFLWLLREENRHPTNPLMQSLWHQYTWSATFPYSFLDNDFYKFINLPYKTTQEKHFPHTNVLYLLALCD